MSPWHSGLGAGEFKISPKNSRFESHQVQKKITKDKKYELPTKKIFCITDEKKNMDVKCQKLSNVKNCKMSKIVKCQK